MLITQETILNQNYAFKLDLRLQTEVLECINITTQMFSQSFEPLNHYTSRPVGRDEGGDTENKGVFIGAVVLRGPLDTIFREEKSQDKAGRKPKQGSGAAAGEQELVKHPPDAGRVARPTAPS